MYNTNFAHYNISQSTQTSLPAQTNGLTKSTAGQPAWQIDLLQIIQLKSFSPQQVKILPEVEQVEDLPNLESISLSTLTQVAEKSKRGVKHLTLTIKVLQVVEKLSLGLIRGSLDRMRQRLKTRIASHFRQAIKKESQLLKNIENLEVWMQVRGLVDIENKINGYNAAANQMLCYMPLYEPLINQKVRLQAAWNKIQTFREIESKLNLCYSDMPY